VEGRERNRALPRTPFSSAGELVRRNQAFRFCSKGWILRSDIRDKREPGRIHRGLYEPASPQVFLRQAVVNDSPSLLHSRKAGCFLTSGGKGIGGEPRRPSCFVRESIAMESNMERMRRRFARLWLLHCRLPSGCAAHSLARQVPEAAPASEAAQPGGATPEPATDDATVFPSYLPAPAATTTSQPSGLPAAGEAELSVEGFVEQALERNPSLAQMVAA
jgi:hypothetical protein